MYWDSVSKKNKRQSKLIPRVKLERSAQTRKGLKFMVLLSIFHIYRSFFLLKIRIMVEVVSTLFLKEAI